MSRKREAVFMGIGVLAGLALSGPASAVTQQLTATPTTQVFYVDGQPVQFEAYQIHSNNFVKLRDIGKAVNFGVAYDAATNSVRIDSTQSYQEEVPAVPSIPTEESVQAALQVLRKQYPHGSTWPAPCRSTSCGPYGSAPSNCAGWATLCSDTAFGKLPWRRAVNPRWEQIRPGDLIRYDNKYGGHVIVVIKIDAEWVTFTDSGTTQKVHWGGQYPRWWLEQQLGLTLYTRYPE